MPSWRALLPGLALWTCTGCSDPGTPGWPVQITVDRVVDRSTVEHDLALSRVETVVLEEMDRSPLFSAGPADGGTRRAEIWVGLLQEGTGETTLRLHLEMQPPAHLERALRDGLSATVSVEPGGGPVDPARDLVFAAQRATAALEARILLAEGKPEAVATVLSVDDPELLSMGLEYVRDHRVGDAADRVAQLLDHSDDGVARLAVECLGVVGSERHVGPMLDALRLEDRGHTQRVYEALGRIRSDRALAFLEFAARNEDDPALAVAAARALDAVREGQPRSGMLTEPIGGRIRRGHR